MRLLAPDLSADASREIEAAIRAPADKPIQLQGLVTADLTAALAAAYPKGLVYDDTVGQPYFSNGSAWLTFSLSTHTHSNVTDGDKGDITVSGGTWTIDNDAVTYAKIQNVSATDKLLGRSTAGSGDVEEIACTSAGRALIDDADASAQRTTLGLGTAATKNTGTSGNNVPLLDGSNVWSGFSDNSNGTRVYGNNFQGSGEGLELRYDASANVGYVVAYDRTGGAGMRLVVQGEQLDVYGGTNGVRFQDTGTTATAPNAYFDSANGNKALRSTYTFGTAATQNTGTSGANLPFLNGNNAWSGTNTSSSSWLSTSATLGIGYATGAGGTVTQNTNKSTGVTLNKVCGAITMNGAALAATTSVSFTLTNSAIASTDTVTVNIASAATTNSYFICVDAVGSGSCRIHLRNITAGSLSEALVLNFAVHKGVTS